jgi:hypothetical protein
MDVVEEEERHRKTGSLCLDIGVFKNVRIQFNFWSDP